MKPVNINLVVKKNIWGKISLGLAALFVFSFCGFAMVNIYDYYANRTIIQIYEARLDKINTKSAQKRVNIRKLSANTKEDEKSRQDLNYLKAIIKKNLFPLSEVLTQIERIKPDQIDINELIFSDNLKKIIIKGTSKKVAPVTRFLKEMDRSEFFMIELSKEEISENQRITFELTAQWI